MHVRHLNAELPVVRRNDEAGMALLATVMIMMLLSALMVGFVSAIVEDQNASGLNRDQTQAYAAAHAGLEQLTADMTALFRRDVSPSRAQINALTAVVPVIQGFEFKAPDGTVGYTALPTFADGQGNPLPEDVNGSDITHGPFQGLKGIITPYEMTVTARSRGMAEVRLRRTLQTVAIPVFQFGMFSETSLAFHAGDAFTFGGRVHTNGNLYLAEGNGSTLTLGDRVTAVGEVIRWTLPNGLNTDVSYSGTVRMIRGTNLYRNLLRTEGSLTQGLGSPQNEPLWTNLSIGTYNSYIRNGRTGVRRLDLPLVADIDGDGNPDGQPIDLIKRPPPGNADPAAVLQQRYFSLASLRILLSDTAADITNLPTIAAGAPVALNIGTAYAPGLPLPTRAPLATSNGPTVSGDLPAGVYKSDHDEPLINGFIKIEMQRNDNTWVDVTGEILDLGIAGRNVAETDTPAPITNRWNNPPEGAADSCQEPQPNSIVRLQRVRDIPVQNPPCGFTGVWPAVTAVSQDFHDYWPLALYDAREGQFRDGVADGQMRLGGLIHYVELDVNNLRRWLLGQIGASGTQAKNENGFIVYFSDRRNNRDAAGNETGEYGFEDVVNPPNMVGTNNVLDAGEDLNGNGVLEVYGATARNLPACNPLLPIGSPCSAAPFDAAALPTTIVPAAGGGNPSPALVARANRIVHFRRALKLVNGAAGNIITPGFTVAAENPIYIQGNYNATAASTLVNPHAASAVIADAVTLLSNAWNDIRSFTSPNSSAGRDATTTGYRLAIITGKGIAFPKPAWAAASFGSDGGAHNFVRQLEDWASGAAITRYRGSFVSLFYNRQATGTFKCCNWDAYNKSDRDWFFDTEFLLPNLLPPGTPMFRDVNTLTFRQLLRPTQ